MRFLPPTVLLLALLLAPGLASAANAPVPTDQPTIQADYDPGTSLNHSGDDPRINPASPMLTSSSGDTVWVNAHETEKCPGNPGRGGEATGGPDGLETWCFEDGPGDSLSTGPGGIEYTFRSYDRRTYRDDYDSLYWHATMYHAITEGNMCMWCGGVNDRCGTWELTTGGYGNYWQQIMQLDLGPFSIVDGCSIQFKTRYSLECFYDYAYLEYYSFRHDVWKPIDGFNGKSWCHCFCRVCIEDWNNSEEHTKCPMHEWGTPLDYPGDWRGPAQAPQNFPEYVYAGGPGGQDYVVVPGDSISDTPELTDLRLRWRFQSDHYYSAEDGESQVRGFMVDDVVVKWDNGFFTDDFSLVLEGGFPPPPWSFPKLDEIYDGWAIRADTIPPGEMVSYPICRSDASWMWSIAPAVGAIPPPDTTLRTPGYMVLLESPAIPVDYSDEEGGPFAHPGVILQHDFFEIIPGITCDYPDLWVRIHHSDAPPPYSQGAWCPWENVDGFIIWDSMGWGFDLNDCLSQWSNAEGADSLQIAWVSIDHGRRPDDCWNPTLPPHVGTQHLVDNVSLGITDAHATTFYMSTREGLFQDTFDLNGCLQNANGDDYLSIGITDPDGLSPGGASLVFSFNGGETWNSMLLDLTIPDPQDPATGGLWHASLCDSPWLAGTEVLYYFFTWDDSGNAAYYPSAAEPGHAHYPDYLEVVILPTPGTRILFVDDFERRSPDYHPCREETTIVEGERFYTEVLEDLGYGYMLPGGYDKYDVNSPSGNQPCNEPQQFSSYDVVVWTTGTLDANTIRDTTQIFLKDYVFQGGNLLVTGDRIGRDLSDPTTPVDPEFYPYLLGARYQGHHASPFLDSERFPKAPLGATQWIPAGDSLHLYSGCDILRPLMDKITIEDVGLPPWSNPGAYLVYEDQVAPYDSVAAIYNSITFSPDTGRVVYLPFSLEAIVDSTTVACDPPPGTSGDVSFGVFHGRAGILIDALLLLGEDPLVPPTSVQVSPGTNVSGFVTALRAVRPNPFNPETSLEFSLARRQRVSLSIYDARGRRVRTLLDETRDVGIHSVYWDGCDQDGRTVASGVYFVEMRATQFNTTRKLALVR